MTTSDQICRLKTVIEMTGLSRSSIYSRMNPGSPYYDPSFPKSFPLYAGTQKGGAKGWHVEAIRKWIRHRSGAAISVSTLEVSHLLDCVQKEAQKLDNTSKLEVMK